MSRKKLTKEEFIEKAKIIHKDKYNYDKFVYKGARIKGIITCKKHGDFEQRPSDHLRGSGCPKCGKEKIGDLKRSNSVEFIEKVKEIHKDKYSYDKFDYVNSYTKGTITCKKHGDFEQTPTSHLNGNGCPECWKEKLRNLKRSNLEEFIEKANKIHNNFYDYSLVDYVHNKKKIKIICPIHGEFEQNPQDHLSGRGCPKCANEKTVERNRILNRIKWCDRFDEGILYLIECWNDVERFIKIGITSKTVEERYKASKSMPYQYKVLKEIYTDSNTVSDTEQYIINFYESYKPKISFKGDSECLSIDEKFQIIEYLENLENLST